MADPKDLGLNLCCYCFSSHYTSSFWVYLNQSHHLVIGSFARNMLPSHRGWHNVSQGEPCFIAYPILMEMKLDDNDDSGPNIPHATALYSFHRQGYVCSYVYISTLV